MSRQIKFCLTFVISLIFILSKLPDSTALSTGDGKRIVLIRHGEKGPQDLHHDVRPNQHTRAAGGRTPSTEHGRRKFPSGLNDAGRSRAQFIRTLFGNQSEFDFGLIFAAPRDMPVETERTYATVAPLARDLGLEVNIKCANNGPQCILREVQNFRRDSDKDILIAWKHRDLNHIATTLGAENARRSYPDERYDIVWIMQDRAILEKRSMHCPILDDNRVDEGDPDLEVEPLQYPWWRSVISSWVGVYAGFIGAGANTRRYLLGEQGGRGMW